MQTPPFLPLSLMNVSLDRSPCINPSLSSIGATKRFLVNFFFAFFALNMSLTANTFSAEYNKWVTTWTASTQGPYPSGNPSAQPNQSFTFPKPQEGARNQSFRMIITPDVWGTTTRIRLTNSLGTQPVTFDHVYVGLQLSSAELFQHSNQPVTFNREKRIVLQPGQWMWSDPIELPFAKPRNLKEEDNSFLEGRKMAVSFHIDGSSGPMTWHAKSLTTSYISPPNSEAVSAQESEQGFPFSTASWFFLDAVDMMLPASTKVILCFGDSITDGTASTMNTDDRWPDVLSRRIRRQFGHSVVVLNAGIGGNQIAGPQEYSSLKPFTGGPSSSMRLERDVLTLSSVSLVVWLEGINDFSKNGNASVDQVIYKLTEGVKRLKAAGIKVMGATVGSALNSTSAAHGSQEQDSKRRSLNDFILSSPIFEGVVDFDLTTLDPQSGEMKAEFVPESTMGGPGDKLHPNRVGYQSMGYSFDLKVLANLLRLTL